jgi:hypothetical protein
MSLYFETNEPNHPYLFHGVVLNKLSTEKALLYPF